MKTLTFLILSLLFSCAFTQSTENSDVVIGKNHTLYSKILKEERTFSISLPDSYSSMNLKYPLLITLDGYFISPVGVTNYLSFAGCIPEMIVVAIHSTDRDRDFTPTNSSNIEGEYIANSGGADNFIAFMEKELLPYLEEHYRIDDFKIIAGHSLGGLLVSYVMLKKTELFQAYFAMSPTLPWDNDWISENVELSLIEKTKRNVWYCLLMDNQEGLMQQSADKFLAKLNQKPREYLSVFYNKYNNEDHISCFLAGFYDSMKWLYHKYKLEEELIVKADAVGIKAHYKTLTAKYHYTIKPTWQWIDWIANWHLLMQRYNESIALYNLALDYYPDNSEAYQKLAALYIKTNRPNEAKNILNKAIKNCSLNEHNKIEELIKSIETH